MRPYQIRFDFKAAEGCSFKATLLVQAAWQSLSRHLGRLQLFPEKYELVFSEPVELICNSRSVKTVTKAQVKLFVSKAGNFAYLPKVSAKSGHAFTGGMLARLVSIAPVLAEQSEAEDVKRIKGIAGRIHPNAWSDLKARILADPEGEAKKVEVCETSITGKFPSYVIESLKAAFDQKTEYSFRKEARGSSGRSLSVEARLGEDGVYRAWFSSEFAGCANGDYWLLINPTTAVFKERD